MMTAATKAAQTTAAVQTTKAGMMVRVMDFYSAEKAAEMLARLMDC